MLKKIICSVLLLSLLSMTGCNEDSNKKSTSDSSSGSVSESQDSSSTQADSEINIIDGVDLKKCTDTVTDMFLNSNGKYPTMDVAIDAPASTDGSFNIILISEKRPDDENIYIKWATECLNALNAEAVKQNSDYKPASDGYYGGLFDKFSLTITVTCNDDVITRWPVYQKIKAGSHDPIILTEGTLDLSAIQ